MSSRLSIANQRLSPALFLFVLLVTRLPADAHRLDEFLQAARLRIGHTNLVIELDLTPGIQTAAGIVSQIDIDKDGHISPTEKEGYAGLVQSALLLELDGKPYPLRVVDHDFPIPDALLQGLGTIHLTLEASYRPLSSGKHHFHLVNRHRNDIGVYLVNALIPEERGIKISRQERDLLQRDYRVYFNTSRLRTKSNRPLRTSSPARAEASVPRLGIKKLPSPRAEWPEADRPFIA